MQHNNPVQGMQFNNDTIEGLIKAIKEHNLQEFIRILNTPTGVSRADTYRNHITNENPLSQKLMETAIEYRNSAVIKFLINRKIKISKDAIDLFIKRHHELILTLYFIDKLPLELQVMLANAVINPEVVLLILNSAIPHLFESLDTETMSKIQKLLEIAAAIFGMNSEEMVRINNLISATSINENKSQVSEVISANVEPKVISPNIEPLAVTIPQKIHCAFGGFDIGGRYALMVTGDPSSKLEIYFDQLNNKFLEKGISLLCDELKSMKLDDSLIKNIASAIKENPENVCRILNKNGILIFTNPELRRAIRGDKGAEECTNGLQKLESALKLMGFPASVIQNILDKLNTKPSEINKILSAEKIFSSMDVIEKIINSKTCKPELYFDGLLVSKEETLGKIAKNDHVKLYCIIKFDKKNLIANDFPSLEISTPDIKTNSNLPITTSTTVDEFQMVAVVAPIVNKQLISKLKQYQEWIKNAFTLDDEGEQDFHITFAMPLSATPSEVIELKKKLSTIELSAIAIEIDSIKAFQNGIIYLEVIDLNDQLRELNSQIISKIKEVGIPCHIRYEKYIPHITLFLTPSELNTEQLNSIKVQNEKYYLTSVVLSESITLQGNTTYKNIAELPENRLLKSQFIELDCFQGGKAFLNKEFDNNPIADYYRLINKLDEYNLVGNATDFSKRREDLLEECRQIYKKILGFIGKDNYPDSMMALVMYARGLIYQYPDRLVLLKIESKAVESTLSPIQTALLYFLKAHKLGYLGAVKNIGIIHYNLGDYQKAREYLTLASNVGAGNEYAEQYLNKIEEELKANNKNRGESKCSVM